ncbi:MAG: hypothetical protein JJE42_15775 [Burkholderiales bacterium]|nr:hypothetical protein [Burkholderiales bacterium]
MRYPLIALTIALSTLFGMAPAAEAQVSFGVNIGIAPGINIGINVPVYPRLVRVPGYPVYYDPRADSNYFFYDGLYWVFQGDDWYSSTWYNGPWSLTDRAYVPLFVLRIPVRYYRRPPQYFLNWRADAPPRWNERWGHEWEQQRRGWDRWDRSKAPKAAPLPSYQRNYSGERYPRAEQKRHELRSKNYRYQPREEVTRQHYQQQRQQQRQPQQQQQRQQQEQQHQRQEQERSLKRGDSRGDSQHNQRAKQAPAAAQHREQAQPPRRGQPQQRQAQEQRKGPEDSRGAPRGKGADKKDRQDEKGGQSEKDERGRN